jgi:hypothetical protein
MLWKLVIFSFGINLFVANPCVALPTGSAQGQIHSFSQASQDHFVYLLLYELLDKQDAGYYLDIGAGHPTDGNNSYVFERNFGWKGVSLDIVDTRKVWYSIRRNPLLIEDATQSNYQSMLKSFPPVIDYLSLDIDNSYDIVLQRIPFQEHVFKVITIEHDSYRFGNGLKEKERSILASFGYYLLCPDVSVFFNGRDCVFEDWWIHPSAFPVNVFSILKSLDLKGKTHNQLIKTIQECRNLK